jgi:hypothetical protein
MGRVGAPTAGGNVQGRCPAVEVYPAGGEGPPADGALAVSLAAPAWTILPGLPGRSRCVTENVQHRRPPYGCAGFFGDRCLVTSKPHSVVPVAFAFRLCSPRVPQPTALLVL